jgi:hypothetical protein
MIDCQCDDITKLRKKKQKKTTLASKQATNRESDSPKMSNEDQCVCSSR